MKIYVDRGPSAGPAAGKVKPTFNHWGHGSAVVLGVPEATGAASTPMQGRLPRHFPRG